MNIKKRIREFWHKMLCKTDNHDDYVIRSIDNVEHVLCKRCKRKAVKPIGFFVMDRTVDREWLNSD